MTAPDLAAEIAAERQRVKREAKEPEQTLEQRQRRQAMGQWHRHIQSIWDLAHLLTDEELLWFSMVTAAAKAKGKHKVRTWSRGTLVVDRPTNGDDAIRLVDLQRLLWDRRWKHERQHDRENRRKVVATLRRLEQPVPEYFAHLDDEGEVAP